MKIEIKNHRLDKAKHCFVSRGRLNGHYAALYGLDPAETCLKVFDQASGVLEEPSDVLYAKWGDDPPEGHPRMNTTLRQATQIQNVCAWHGLAPRVYGLGTAEVAGKICPLQVCEWVGGDDAPDDGAAIGVLEQVKALGNRIGFANEKDDVSTRDVIGGKLVDFQHFAFTEPYEEIVRALYINDGRYGKVYYQALPELALDGGPRRSAAERLKTWNLQGLDFAGKRVIDIGCAGGSFVRHAYESGAAVAMGVDLPEPISAARHVSNMLCQFDIAFGAADLLKEPVPAPSYFWDVVFFLSMNMHLSPDFIEREVCRLLSPVGAAVVEKNGRITDEEMERTLKGLFREVTLVGRSTDQADCQKPVYLCRGKKR